VVLIEKGHFMSNAATIHKVITSNLGTFISDVLHGKVKKGEAVFPNLSQFDVYHPKQRACKAFRMKFQGLLLDDKELARHLRKIDTASKETSSCSDLDGDGQNEVIDHYTVKPDILVPFANDGEFCLSNEWSLLSIVNHQTNLYVVHFSKGDHAVVDSMLHMLRAEKK
jgi:hypothetical protein